MEKAETSQLAQFDKLKAEVIVFVEPIKAIAVTSQETADLALNTCKDVKALQKKVEERRKELVGPLNEQVKRINAYAKELTAPLDKAEVHLKGHLAKWEIELEKVRQADLRKAEEERKKALEEAESRKASQNDEEDFEAMFMSDDERKRQQIIAQVEQQRVESEIHSQHKSNVAHIMQTKVPGARRVWTFEVEDAGKVPREFLCVDEKKIREAIRSGAREIPGVRIFQDLSVAVR